MFNSWLTPNISSEIDWLTPNISFGTEVRTLPAKPTLVFDPWLPGTLKKRGPGTRLQYDLSGSLSPLYPQMHYSTSSTSSIPVIDQQSILYNGATKSLPTAQRNIDYPYGAPEDSKANLTSLFMMPMRGTGAFWTPRSPTYYTADSSVAYIGATNSAIGLARNGEVLGNQHRAKATAYNKQEPFSDSDWCIVVLQGKLTNSRVTTYRYQNGRVQVYRHTSPTTIPDNWAPIFTNAGGANQASGGCVTWDTPLTEQEELQAVKYFLKYVAPQDVPFEYQSLHSPPVFPPIPDLECRWSESPYELSYVMDKGDRIGLANLVPGKPDLMTGGGRVLSTNGRNIVYDMFPNFETTTFGDDPPGLDGATIDTPSGHTFFLGFNSFALLGNNSLTIGKWDFTFNNLANRSVAVSYNATNSASINTGGNARPVDRAFMAVVRVNANNQANIFSAISAEPFTGRQRFGQVISQNLNLTEQDPLNPPGQRLYQSVTMSITAPTVLGYFTRALTNQEIQELFVWARRPLNGYFQE